MTITNYIQCFVKGVILSFFFISCKNPNPNDIFLKNNEVLVYYDKYLDDFKVIKRERYNLPKNYNYSISKYNLNETKLSEHLMVTTKDGQSIDLKMSYWYQINEKEIVELHKKYGSEFLNRLILPQLREVIRTEYKKINFKNYDKEKMRVLLLTNMINKEKYSRMIISKTIIIN